MFSVHTKVVMIIVPCTAATRVACRGTNQVVSCLDMYENKLYDLDTLMLFSDSCPAQKKNLIAIHYIFW